IQLTTGKTSINSNFSILKRTAMKRNIMNVISLLLLVTLTQNCLAQSVTDFKLSDYKYRTAGYKALQLDADLKGDNSTESQNKANNVSHFNLLSNLNFLQTYSLDKKEKAITYGGNLTVDIQHVDSTTGSYGVSPFYENDTRIYKNKFFYQYGYGASGAF